MKTFISDNGTNLVAGNKEMKESLAQWNAAQMDEKCKVIGINWKFIPRERLTLVAFMSEKFEVFAKF